MRRNAGTDSTHEYHSAVLDILYRRTSVRSYQNRQLPDEMLLSVLNAARQAPTSSNLQAYSMVVVRDHAKRQALAELAGHQQHVVAAPVIVAICADLYRARRICEAAETTPTIDACDMNLMAVVDAAVVGMCASIAAESLGLGTVMIGGLRNEPARVSELLDLPPHVFAVFGLCLGWPSEVPPVKPRLPQELVIHHERYGSLLSESAISAYNDRLAAHHRSIGRRHDIPWSERVARLCASPHRLNLKGALSRLGFRFR